MKGLDISSYQNGINFDTIKNADINFLGSLTFILPRFSIIEIPSLLTKK